MSKKFFTENFEKAIKGIDSLIWSTIREYSKQSKQSKNYFITTNFADFWNYEKTDLHSNLKLEASQL